MKLEGRSNLDPGTLREKIAREAARGAGAVHQADSLAGTDGTRYSPVAFPPMKGETGMNLHFLLVLCLLLTACGQTPSGGIEGTEWTLISLNGKAPLESHPITLDLKSGELGGKAGCNSYGGKYEADGSSLSFPDGISSTAMACASEEAMNQEAEYLRTLQQADTYRIAGERLEMMDAGGQTILVFEKVK